MLPLWKEKPPGVAQPVKTADNSKIEIVMIFFMIPSLGKKFLKNFI
jgi:hypothetical protein